MYTYQMKIILSLLYGFKYSYLILIIIWFQKTQKVFRKNTDTDYVDDQALHGQAESQLHSLEQAARGIGSLRE